MKRFVSILVITFTTVTLHAQREQPAMHLPMQPETVTVSGTGKAMLVPDRFTFNVAVQTVAPTVDEAVNQNNTKVVNVVAALKKAGATDKEIRTSNFAIWPQQRYVEGQLPIIIGYQVSNNITVTKDKIGDAGRLLQVAINAGVNQSSGLNFEVSDPARGRDQGLKAAFDDARAKAQLLAQAAGRTLGKAMSISEGARPDYEIPRAMVGRAMAMKAEAAVSEIPVEGGSQELSYSVTVAFELR